MDLRLVVVLGLIPILDVMVLVILATTLLSAPLVVAEVVLTGLLGLLVVRAEGRRTLGRLRRTVDRGELPDDEVLDGALLLASGTFFLTPGVVTDFLGLILVVPPTRYPVRIVLKRYLVVPYLDAKTAGLVTGDVYAGGFPNPEADVSGGEGPGTVDEDD